MQANRENYRGLSLNKKVRLAPVSSPLELIWDLQITPLLR